MVPTNTLFLTFNQPCLPKENKVGYLMVKVDIFIPNPLRCLDYNGSVHTSHRCKNKNKKQTKNARSAERTNTREAVMDRKCAQTAMILTPPPPKIAQSCRKRRRFNVSALKTAFISMKADRW